jgi:hypothetical protein
LRARLDRACHHQHLNPLDSSEELREHTLQLRECLVISAVLRKGVAGAALGVGNAGEAEFAQITRESGLGDLPSAFGELSSQLFLAGHGFGRDDLADDLVALDLVGHATDSCESVRRRSVRSREGNDTSR